MPDRDIVLAKVQSLERCLARVEDAERRRTTGLAPLDALDITVLNLQRAAQAMIDLAAHVVASEGLGLPDSLAANFTMLADAGVIDREIAMRMVRMTGFRNVVVHEYQELDPTIVETIVRKRLGDLRAFAQAVVARFGI